MLPDRISTIIENNTIEYFLSLGYDARNELCDTPKIKFVLNDQWNSRILQVCLDDDEADRCIKAIRAKLTERNLFALWLVTPSSRPESLERRLAENGFSLNRSWRSMAISAGHRPTSLMPCGLKIVEVTDDVGLKAWADVMVKNFDMDEDVQGPFSAYYAGIGIGDRSKRRYYTGHVDGMPVATAALFYGREAAGIYYVSTAKAYEGNGIGTAMTCHVLGEARNAGYRIATLNASDQGYPLYKRLGFKEYYETKIYHSED